MIRLLDVRMSFGRHLALDGLSLEIQQGEVLGLLGPNGAGKTTCLRLITGYLTPTAGEVWVGGLPASSRQARRGLGYLPEGAPVYGGMRVSEYLAFRGRLRGLAGRALGAEQIRVSSICGLEQVGRQLCGGLSRGYRQRLGLAAALLGAPGLVVLDEPTAGLDPNQARQARQLMAGLGGHQTALLATHDLREVEQVCSRVLILHRGRLAAEGAPEVLAAEQEGGLEGLFARVTGERP